MEQGLVSPGNIDPNATRDELRDWIYTNIGSNHHPVGTCKVGNTDSDPSAVIDKDFRVAGIQNLRVIDASVFPKVPSGNTNAPTMSVAMIGAEKILQDNHNSGRRERRKLRRGVNEISKND